MAEGGTEENAKEAVVSTLNPEAAEFKPGAKLFERTDDPAEAPASLVFGGGGHFLSKYTDRESKLRRRKEGDGAGAAPQPDRVNVQLNQLIVHAGTPERILQVVDENFEQLNVVNLITALHRLATVSLASRKAAVRRELRFRRLVTKLSDTVRKADPASLKPQDLSNVVWGLTKLGVQNGVLFNLLAERILLRLEAFKPVNLSMTLWAFARSGIYDEKLLAATSGEVKRQLKDFQPQQVANTAWAFAKCGYVDQELFALAAEQALAELDQYQPMNCSMLVYAFALANQRHSQLFEEVAKRCTVPTLKFSLAAPHVVSNLALAFSEAQIHVPELYQTVAEVAIQSIHEFRPKQLITLAEAFAKAQTHNEELFKSISRMVAKNVDDFQKEELQELFQAYEALGASNSEIKKAMNQESGSRFSSMMFVMIVILIALTLIVWRI